MNILVSRCLKGVPCRYDGQSKPNSAVMALKEQGHRLIGVCPEVDGGLETPRPPAEIQPDGRVVNEAGTDVTAQYRRGAELALETARKYHCTAAILKAKSPSCGDTQIYDGTFSRTLIAGQGVAADLLTKAGIHVVNENNLDELFQ